MKIFYGVQGTGNGHITRARVMAKELYAAGCQVDFQFSGRPAEQYFDMEVFNGYRVKTGLTFNTHKGQVSYLKTALEASPIRFVRDIGSLDLSAYDLVISDFEPVTAWAAKRQQKKVLGIGHQYAFGHKIPRAGGDPIADRVMKYFAPADIGIGLHWHHFGQPILPPIIETPELPQQVQANKIVVYLPFEDGDEVVRLLCPFENFEFHVYSPQPAVSKYAHVQCKPLSRDGFQRDLYDCAGIISNAGFELASESLQLGKKILVKPLHSQMEQISNAEALKQLGYGHTMFDLAPQVIEDWLHNPHSLRVTYPNVAKIIVQWINAGMPAMDTEFVERVWESVEVLQVKH
ncbi:MJ1255/VC2487 family glycosyltransferase [Methylomonas koyamae]|uniref:Glycosyltransferase n=1 Tax=Methylomonas koyamae TaxID=702114 RepID=A0A291IP38_9GAMM|nr:MJ1255/VC2487 family glycosyltransferase [Methylomonas koyamae]ATG91988.1 glycosyltransferase [Methylomonas koyamae]OAI25482.1 glycosyltransferase [Methylomonas koyamae]WNB75434.1 glycosyltransferase family protein [Methylomonas koyamae]